MEKNVGRLQLDCKSKLGITRKGLLQEMVAESELSSSYSTEPKAQRLALESLDS